MEGVRGQGAQVAIVPQVQLLQQGEALEGGGLDVGDVVGVDPEGDCGGAEVASQQPVDLVVLQENALAVRGDAFRDGQEVVCLAGNGGGRGVADTVMWAGPGQLQTTENQQELQAAGCSRW